MDRITCESLDASWAIPARWSAWASSPAARLRESVAGAPRDQAPVRLSRSQTRSGLMTLRARYRRSPEGCFESGLAVPDARGVPSWLAAAACEPRRNRVPSSRCRPRPHRAAREAQAAQAKHARAAGSQHPGGVHGQTAPGLACRAPEAPPASDPTPPDAARRPGPAKRTGRAPNQASTATRPGTAARAPQGARVSGTARGARLRGRHHLDSEHWGAESRGRLGSPPRQRRSPSMNPFDLQRPRASGTCLWAWTCRPRFWRSESCAHCAAGPWVS